MRLTTKPGLSRTTHRRLAQRDRPLRQHGHAPNVGRGGAHHLDQRHLVDGVEEVHPGDALRVGQSLLQPLHAAATRCWWPAPPSAPCGLPAPEDGPLGVEVLDRRLDHHVHVMEAVPGRRPLHGGEAPLRLVLGQHAAVHGLGEQVLDAHQAGVEGGLVDFAARRPWQPLRAASWAMPAPMMPAPTTPTRRTSGGAASRSDSGSLRAFSLRNKRLIRLRQAGVTASRPAAARS